MPFKIYRSSAGSGKTFTLVKEYLKLSLANDRPDAYRSILAITFTNKAAEEMKSRVLNVLAELSEPKAEENPMAKVLRNEMGISDEILKIRAHNTLRHMLHNYSDISISTIDHFTHKLIRSFAQDLELSINFEVELDTDNILHEIVKDLLNRVGDDKLLTTALVNVIDQNIDSEKNWSISGTLHDNAKALLDEESRFHLNELRNVDLQQFNDIQNKLKKRIKQNTDSVVQPASEILKLMRQLGITADKLYNGTRGISSFLNKCAQGKLEPPSSTAWKVVNEDKWTSKNATEADLAAIEQIKQPIVELVNRVAEVADETNYLSLIYQNLYAVALLDEMLRIQKRIEKEDETLPIAEFNHLVSDVVMTETAPFIYERIGHRYRHFLVDEFQDTSVLQWFNLLPLIDESLAQDNLCLVVGDAKQSIYRWRGGDVRQFQALPNPYVAPYLDEQLQKNEQISSVMSSRQAVLKQRALTDNLTSNYRSARNVVEFNNELFDGLAKQMPESISNMYDGAAQLVQSQKEGYVQARFLEAPKGNETWAEYTPITLELIRTWVKESLADGFSAGDIAIITRRNADAVAIAQFLVENKYNVVSNESLLINSSAKVRLLFNLAKWLIEPLNAVNIVEMVQHLGLVRNETELTSDRLIALRDDPAKGAMDLLKQLYPKVHWKSIAEENTLAIFELLNHHVIGNEPDTYVNFFLDEVLRYSSTVNRGLLGFIAHWEEKRGKLSIALPEKDDAIRIMTIHKSKGLEFPVVIHPFADYPTLKTGNKLWVYLNDEELDPLDRMRLQSGSKLEESPFTEENQQENALRKLDMFNELYVTLTRAANRLYLSGKVKLDAKEPSTASEHVFSYLKTIDDRITETMLFEKGARETISRGESELANLKLTEVGNPFWRSRISISKPSKQRWLQADQTDARNMGILIHDALAHIKTVADVGKAVQILIEDGRVSEQEAEEVRMQLRTLLSRSEMQPLYSGEHQIRNEADIKLANGEWVRPDRVVYSGNRAWVLDYKTGLESNAHIKQMKGYKEAMEELGFKHVEGLLVYLSTERVTAV